MAEEKCMEGLKHKDHRWRMFESEFLINLSQKPRHNSFKSLFKLFKQENHSNNQTHFSMKAKATCPLTNIETYP